MSKSTEQLDRLRKEYEPYEAFVGSELGRIDALEKELERSKDPIFIAFRENPITQELFKSAAKSYRSSKLLLANDDGKMTQEERMKLHVGTLWSSWYMRALGGNPKKVQKDVEREIQKFAEEAGIG